MPEKRGGKAKRGANLGRAIMRQNFHSTTATAAQIETDRGKHALRSITHTNDLEELMAHAVLANTDFTSTHGEVVVLTSETIQKRPLERPAEPGECDMPVPRRPSWLPTDDAKSLDAKERAAFLSWRRALADVEESTNRLLTPFEKNLEVWRQLWRVLERSQLVVQIVDARNPLLFRSIDLEKYVGEFGAQKRCLLLVNKADLLTRAQRKLWAEYFRAHRIGFVFWSAKAAQEEVEEEARRERRAGLDGVAAAPTPPESVSGGATTDAASSSTTDGDATLDVLGREALLAMLMQLCPEPPPDRQGARRRTVGLVGYPNVGKSSTVNALVAEVKTSVSATPGKTKHFQTLLVPGMPNLVLCDCPGLVFPSVAGSKAQMICDGILPIDQMTDYVEPTRLLLSRLGPDAFFHAYGLRLRTESERLEADDGDAPEPARELLIALALARGFMSHTKGGPDESRASRILLKDLVNAKLLHCMPPPGVGADEVKALASTHVRQRARPREPTAERWLVKGKVEHERQERASAKLSGRKAAAGVQAPWRREGAVPDRLEGRGARVPLTEQ